VGAFGGAFVAFTKQDDFGRFLEAELIDHLVGRPYSPRGGGKVESAVGTLRRELWDVFQFESAPLTEGRPLGEDADAARQGHRDPHRELSADPWDRRGVPGRPTAQQSPE
jgi:transposase